MNRTDRLLAIVLELQARGRQRAEDLADTFEVSKRTIYRDIAAMCEAGIPVVSIPGQGYSLMAGYFLPPLAFTTEEATLLLLGAEWVARTLDASYQMAAGSACRKIEAVLPESIRPTIHDLQQNVRYISIEPSKQPEELAKLQLLRRALLEHHTVRFCYFSRYGEQQAPPYREVDPYSLVHMGDTWYMAGYCHLRQAMRYFRLDRIEQPQVLAQSFVRLVEQPREECSRSLLIQALFTPEVSRWVKESKQFFMTDLQDSGEGLRVTLQVRHEQEILPWLLGWGSQVRVLEPESVRQRLVWEAKHIWENHRPHN